MTGVLLQFGGSLLAVVLLTLFVSRLGLGRDPPLLSEAEARKQAADAIYGFQAIDVALDKFGHCALLSDGAGRIVLVATKGVHFTVRQLGSASGAEHRDGVVKVRVGEMGFGAVSLDLGCDAAAWGKRINALKS